MMPPNLAVLRSAIGPMLTETGTLTRLTGATVEDPLTGVREPVWETVWSGPLLVRPEDRSLRVADAGDVTYSVLRFDVTLPAETPAQIGDNLTIETCPGDASLAGQTLRLIDVPRDGWQIARFAVAERLP